jgi:hypothetical protein
VKQLDAPQSWAVKVGQHILLVNPTSRAAQL